MTPPSTRRLGLVGAAETGASGLVRGGDLPAALLTAGHRGAREAAGAASGVAVEVIANAVAQVGSAGTATAEAVRSGAETGVRCALTPTTCQCCAGLRPEEVKRQPSLCSFAPAWPRLGMPGRCAWRALVSR